MAIAVFCFTTTNAQSKTTTQMADTAAMVYKCPMKCEGDKTYNKAGKCPVCGMSLKKMELQKTATKEAQMKM